MHSARRSTRNPAMRPNNEAGSIESPDAECMTRLANGDDLALNDLMDRWGGRVAAFLFRMTGDRNVATDLAQDVFVRLYQSRRGYRPSGKFSSYLFAIASNLARNHLRWKARHPAVSLDATDGETGVSVVEAVDSALTPDEAAVGVEKARAIQQAFLCLPADLREAMTLFLHEDMSHAEIAKLLGCSKKAVETRVYRARQLLRARLENLLN